MKKLVWLVLTLLAVLVAAFPVGAQDLSGIEFRGEDDPDALKKILGYYMGAGVPMDQQIVVWIGSLPDDLELPTPEGVSIVGSVAFENIFYPNTRIFLESEMTPEEVISFYEDNLQGWEVAPNSYSGPTGFVDQNYGIYAFFCPTDEDAEKAVNVNSQSQGDGSTTIFLDVVPVYGAPCQNFGPQKGEDVYRLLPVLTTPEGVTLVSPMGGGGGGGGAYVSAASDALLRSELSLAEVLDLYNAQIEAAGWTQVASDATDVLAGSTWTFTDEDDKTWGSTLTLIANPTAEGEYMARVAVGSSTAP